MIVSNRFWMVGKSRFSGKILHMPLRAWLVGFGTYVREASKYWTGQARIVASAGALGLCRIQTGTGSLGFCRVVAGTGAKGKEVF